MLNKIRIVILWVWDIDLINFGIFWYIGFICVRLVCILVIICSVWFVVVLC